MIFPARGPLSGSSRPRILGVNPWIYDFAAYNLWSRPAGLLACLDMLRSAGACVGLFDCTDRFGSDSPWPKTREHGTGHYPKTLLPKPNVLKAVPRNWGRYGLPLERVHAALLDISPPPDAVLLTSVMTYWYPGVTAMIHLLRRIWPKTPIILGGIYATLCPDHAQRQEADVVLHGPLERPDNWDRLWTVLGFSPPPLPGAAGLNLALDLYPSPDFSILLTSRGCPFNCPYCASNCLFPDFQRHKPLDVLGSLEGELRRGVTDFAFYDDALLVNARDWLIPWLRMLRRITRPIRLHTPNAVHVRYLTREVCELMFSAGCRTIRLGLETAAFADRPDAKLNARQWSRGVHALFAAGFKADQIGAYVLFGLPDQDMEEVLQSIRFSRSFSLNPHLTFFSPIPGTRLFTKACASSAYPLAEEPLFHNPSLWPCVPGGFSWEKRKIWRELTK